MNILVFRYLPIYLGIFYFYCLNYLGAQSYQLTTYQTESGLPTNLVKAIVKDTLGFIWLASDEGVARFDGRNFINFKKELPSSYTKSLFVSKRGTLLVINDLGIIEISSKLDTAIFKTLLVGGTSTAEKNKVMYPKEIFEDCNGTLWISEPNSVLRYQNGKPTRYLLPEKLNTTNFLRSFNFAETSCGNLYLSAFRGALLYFNAPKNAFEEVELPQNLGDISSMLKIDENTLWLGYFDGVAELKVSQGRVESLTRLIDLPGVSFLRADDQGDILIGTWDKGLYEVEMRFADKVAQKIGESKTAVINHIFIDNERNIWLSSDDGIELLKPNLFSRLSLTDVNSYIQAIHLNPDQSLLVCDGSSIHQVWRRGKDFEKKNIYNYSKSNILAVTQSRNGLFVGAGNDRLLCIKDGKTTELDLGAYGKSIFALFADHQANVWVSQYGERVGVVKVSPDLKPKYYTTQQGIESQITVVRETAGGTIYCGGRGKNAYLYVYHENEDRFENVSTALDIATQTQLEVNDIFFDKQGQIWLGTNQGLFIKKKNSIRRFDLGPKYSQENIKSILIDKLDNLWIGTNLGIIKFKNNQSVLFEKVNGLSTVTISPRGLIQSPNGNLYVATANGLNYLIDQAEDVQTTPTPVFLYLRADNQKIDFIKQDLDLSYRVTLEGKVLSFTYPNARVLYQYRLSGLNDNWSEPSELNQILIQRIPYGNYALQIRAKQQGNYAWSAPISFKFEVLRPWYWTYTALTMYVLGAIGLVWLLIYWNTRRLKQQRELLTQKVTEATHQIAERAESLRQVNSLLQQQTKEINFQKESIESQKNTIETTYRTIERKNKQITDSIRYAQTIQKVILRSDEVIKKSFKDYFLIYQPKDVVSGDFYWAFKDDSRWFVAVVDCTGHGVPGAFMSMIGYSLLYRIIKLKGETNPANILKMLHSEVRVVLRQKDGSNNDGMDICLCMIDRLSHQENQQNKFKVTFCGAKRPLYYFANGSMNLLEGERRSIGGWQSGEADFQNHEVILYEKDIIYLSTDGLADQNNPKRRKFGENQMLRLMEKNAVLSMPRQKEEMLEGLIKFQESSEQRDDITLLGIKL
jgi:AraC family transcriptional regulator, chitin signaling transcriptional activator